MSRADWDDLLTERIAIMTEVGVELALAQAMAFADTTAIFGVRP